MFGNFRDPTRNGQFCSALVFFFRVSSFEGLLYSLPPTGDRNTGFFCILPLDIFPSMSPKAIPLPDFPLFPVFFFALIVRMFRIFCYCRLRFFCSMPAVDPHVPHILWIAFEETGMTGFVRDGFGCNLSFSFWRKKPQNIHQLKQQQNLARPNGSHDTAFLGRGASR